MRSHIKKSVAILMILLTFSISLHTYAAEPVDNNDYSHEVVPGHEKTSRWSYTDSVHVAMGIDPEGYVDVYCDVNGYHNLTDKIISYVYLQKRVGDHWENLGCTVDIVYDWQSFMEDYYDEPVDWGYDYRTHNRIYVYAGDEYEFIEVDSIHHHYHDPAGIPDCSLNEGTTP
ncbi:MAG: hypothetical protein EOM34_11605 [Clostridia bacterium]|nr:hypothetical protein [Lachnospiraceae bacterium]NCC01301.1 hypothetical protein [Clostridia bacterium]NCD03148.1 hypothetical protein [Clostridia bacterium]